MPLSLASEFTTNDIHSVKVFKGGVVYLLRGNGDDIVVKSESITVDQSKHFDLSKKAMGVVDKNVKASKKLSDNELNALIGYVMRQKSLVQFQLKDRLPGAAEDLDLALTKLRDPLRKNVWYKMPQLAMLDLQGALESHFGKTEPGFKPSKDVDQSSKPLREFLKTLRASGGLEALGKVIAIDSFSGNTDRFVPGAQRKLTLAGWSYSFKTLQNIGNLMIVGHGSAKTISGMDFADPASCLVEAEQSFEQQTQNGGWFGNYIADSKLRHAFAKEIITDLEVVLNISPKKSLRDKLPGGPLGFGAQRRLEAGMVTGGKMLTKMYREKVKRNKVFPQSFIDRANYFEAMIG